MRYKVEAVLAGEDQVALEESFTHSWNVLTAVIDVLLRKSKVNHLYLVKIVFVGCEGRGQADEDVVELDVIEGVSGLVDDLDLFEEL